MSFSADFSVYVAEHAAEYALEHGLIARLEDLANFLYTCHRGKRAVCELYKHRSHERLPRILPLMTSYDFGEILTKFEKHAFDGENVEEIINASFKLLGERKQLSDEVLNLANRKRILDSTGKFMLPSYVEKVVNIPVGELVSISLNLPQRHPLKRADIANCLPNNYDIDEVISGLVTYTLI